MRLRTYTGCVQMAYEKETAMRVWRRNLPFVFQSSSNIHNRHAIVEQSVDMYNVGIQHVVIEILV